MKRMKFKTSDEVKTAVTKLLKGLTFEFFEEGYQKDAKRIYLGHDSIAKKALQ